MRKAKAIAIAIEQNPFTLAIASFTDTVRLVVDFMYGTPDRTRLTCLFALGLAILGGMLDASAAATSCAG